METTGISVLLSWLNLRQPFTVPDEEPHSGHRCWVSGGVGRAVSDDGPYLIYLFIWLFWMRYQALLKFRSDLIQDASV